jgi:uncharacterized protein (UPF0276 family)
MNIPESGVGIIYFSGFEPIIAANPDLIQVIEIEPQTFWYRLNNGLAAYAYDEASVQYLQDLQKPVLFHGVGYPIAGTITPDEVHVDCLHKMMARLQPLTMSEHLSFNTLALKDSLYNTNFLLPPLQTEAGIATAVSGISNYKQHFDIPFLFETGVNYLAPQPFELPDGYFVNQVAEQADCNILLDVHNILANEKNGRQKVMDYVKQLSHERVTQIHLAGGFYFNGYYLDAHSGPSSDEVLALFEAIVVQLPNLKVITFEMLPEYISLVPEKDIRLQLEKMNAIWDRRGKKTRAAKPLPQKPVITVDSPDVLEWENTLGLLAIKRLLNQESNLATALQADKGLTIIQDLIEKFKGSLLVSSLKLSCRYLMLTLGMDTFNALLRDFWQVSVTKLFASDNGIDFADYLLQQDTLTDNKVLLELIVYEKASLQSFTENRTIVVNMSYNPLTMIRHLIDRKIPAFMEEQDYEIEITPDQGINDQIKTVFHS